MEKALVTGGAGFIGSHVAEHLLATGMEVVVLDDLSGGFRGNVPSAARFCRASVTDEDTVNELFERHRFQYVYHLAAHAAERLSHHQRRLNYTNNVLGSVTLINAAVNHGIRCFVFTSSMAVYGAPTAPFSEDMTPQPVDPYGIAKLAVEHDLRAADQMFGLPYIIFRPHNVYGERQNVSDPYRNVIGIFMRQVLAGQACTIFGDGSQSRAFSYVGDLAPLIAGSVHVPGAYKGTYNIGADEPCSVAELAELVQEALGRDVGTVDLPARGEVEHAWCSHGRAVDVFGHRASTPLREGLRRMAEWARTLDPHPPQFTGELEIPRGLPVGWEAPSPNV